MEKLLLILAIYSVVVTIYAFAISKEAREATNEARDQKTSIERLEFNNNALRDEVKKVETEAKFYLAQLQYAASKISTTTKGIEEAKRLSKTDKAKLIDDWNSIVEDWNKLDPVS